MATPQELNEQRLGIIAKQEALNNKVIAEGREFTSEEDDQYKRMDADQKALKAKALRLVEIETAQKELADPTRAAAKPNVEGEKLDKPFQASAEYKQAFNALLANRGVATPQIQATLEKAVNTQGGYLIPIDYETTIIDKLYDANIMRQLGTVTRTSSNAAIPMEGNLPTFSWIDELGNYGLTDATFSQNLLNAWKLGGIMTISEELLMDAFLNIEDYIAGRAAISAGFAEESAFTIGDGNKKPTGWVTTVSTAGTTKTSLANNTASSVDMFALMYSVARPYRKNGSFIVADTLLQQLRQEKATTGQYLWQAALTADAPDVYLGKPIYTSDFLAPFAPGSVSAGFGDFSYYQIVDRVGWSIQKLNELYAGTGMVGYRMWERTDGKLLRPEAVNILTTHA